VDSGRQRRPPAARRGHRPQHSRRAREETMMEKIHVGGRDNGSQSGMSLLVRKVANSPLRASQVMVDKDVALSHASLPRGEVGKLGSCPDNALIPWNSRSTFGPPSGSARLRCLTPRDLGLALDRHSPRVPRSFVADRHLCQGVCLGGSATSVRWRQAPCFAAWHQRTIRTLPLFCLAACTLLVVHQARPGIDDGIARDPWRLS
jgi:hypothetical protein